MKRTNTPEHYLQMIPQFRTDIDTRKDPENAFISGTPRWMIDEWVQFNTHTIRIC